MIGMHMQISFTLIGCSSIDISCSPKSGQKLESKQYGDRPVHAWQHTN